MEAIIAKDLDLKTLAKIQSHLELLGIIGKILSENSFTVGFHNTGDSILMEAKHNSQAKRTFELSLYLTKENTLEYTILQKSQKYTFPAKELWNNFPKLFIAISTKEMIMVFINGFNRKLEGVYVDDKIEWNALPSQFKLPENLESFFSVKWQSADGVGYKTNFYEIVENGDKIFNIKLRPYIAVPDTDEVDDKINCSLTTMEDVTFNQLLSVFANEEELSMLFIEILKSTGTYVSREGKYATSAGALLHYKVDHVRVQTDGDESFGLTLTLTSPDVGLWKNVWKSVNKKTEDLIELGQSINFNESSRSENIRKLIIEKLIYSTILNRLPSYWRSGFHASYVNVNGEENKIAISTGECELIVSLTEELQLSIVSNGIDTIAKEYDIEDCLTEDKLKIILEELMGSIKLFLSAIEDKKQLAKKAEEEEKWQRRQPYVREEGDETGRQPYNLASGMSSFAFQQTLPKSTFITLDEVHYGFHSAMAMVGTTQSNTTLVSRVVLVAILNHALLKLVATGQPSVNIEKLHKISMMITIGLEDSVISKFNTVQDYYSFLTNLGNQYTLS